MNSKQSQVIYKRKVKYVPKIYIFKKVKKLQIKSEF